MTVILVRHGESSANVARTLAGRTPGVGLTERGREQAAALERRLATLPLEAVVRSPLQRCAETVAPLADKLGVDPEVEDRLAEVDYGRWTGRPIAQLLDEPLWAVVQRHASGAVFPGGEGLADVAHRAVAAVREHDRTLAERFGRDVLWLACTHGDVVKAILADALGIHLDGFQRVVVEPASLSVVRYGATGAQVLRLNDTGSDLGLSQIGRGRHAADTGPTPGGEVGGEPKSG